MGKAIPILTLGALDPVGDQEDALQAQQDANYRNEQRMKEAEKKREEEFNKLNQKKPNIAALLAANTKKGTGTSITGPGGVDQSTLTLGRASLLGR